MSPPDYLIQWFVTVKLHWHRSFRSKVTRFNSLPRRSPTSSCFLFFFVVYRRSRAGLCAQFLLNELLPSSQMLVIKVSLITLFALLRIPTLVTSQPLSNPASRYDIIEHRTSESSNTQTHDQKLPECVTLSSVLFLFLLVVIPVATC
jgi:hypothetical protein